MMYLLAGIVGFALGVVLVAIGLLLTADDLRRFASERLESYKSKSTANNEKSLSFKCKCCAQYRRRFG